jgi:hypothetical protein
MQKGSPKTMNSKPKITIIAVVATVVLSIVASSIQAAPADDIQRAVATAGASSVSAAPADVFLHAFSSVVVRARGNAAAYVAAAIAMRHDLAPQITVAALRAYHTGRNKVIGQEGSCDWVDPIIRTAIAAAPPQAVAIVLAAIAAEPYARECILAAAGMSDKDLRLAYTRRSDGKEVIDGKEVLTPKEAPCPECPLSAWLRPPGIDVGNVNSSIVGTINPANLGQGGIVSPEHH